MSHISEWFGLDPSYQRLWAELRAKKRRIYLNGLIDESTGPFLSSFAEDWKRPAFVVCETQKRARELADELQSNGTLAVHYPEEEPRFFQTDSTVSPIRRKRLAIMHQLASGDPVVVVTTIASLKRPITPPRVYSSSAITLEPRLDVDREDLIRRLVEMRYERVESVEHPGEFAMRGGILDLFPPSQQHPVRVEFFDTEIDGMRFFDVMSQRSIDHLDCLKVTPAEEFQFSDDAFERVMRGMREELSDVRHHPNEGRNDARAVEKFERVLKDMGERHSISNPDFAFPYLSDEEKSYLYDYLPEDGVVFFEDIDRVMDEATAKNAQLQEELTSLYENGEILRSHLRGTVKDVEILGGLYPYTQVNMTRLLKTMRSFHPDALIQIKTLEIENFEHRWDDFLAFLKRHRQHKERILLLLGDGFEAIQERLREGNVGFHLLPETQELKEDAFHRGDLLLSPGRISHGFRLPESGLILVSLHELRTSRSKRKKAYAPKRKTDLLQYQDLTVGDYVVHDVYGIGEYLGTETIEYNGLIKDFIKISYKGADALYVPTTDMDRVTKYIGSGGPKPKISSLGGADWKRSKEKAKKAVDAIAEDLLKLYAARSKVKGFAFSEDSPWQKEFEESFPYDETPSQLRATAEIKADMESSKPMDRLLCGDVGYGKTEVALRAAFKAVMDGKQVAFLAPTTILVQQHYQTMSERFGAFPLRVEFLSRFKSPEQQKAVIQALARGEVDIVVGTHRLLSKDVHFKDLGLLIIDEEQRFGVKDKEKMKALKESVDVLTLSATPIPRTLQLSLTGIRDMSLLEEPPEARYPTISYVMEMDPMVIREAIQRELDRNGQVYYVYNRIHDLSSVQTRLQKLVPEATIVAAHGRMSIRELEQVMETFVSGEADILLSTTIIETGMDIPNVNTLIVRRADHMGLAQLYQLKGRIGRSDRQSYAYFTYEQAHQLSEASEKRLKAIRDFTEFGSGYKIAMRDLELRGAGNLLGESQSGHIAQIGYELYVRMLEEAVAEAKGEQRATQVEGIPVDLKISAYIPDSYIGQSSDKIMMYRQIASIESEMDYATIVEEMIDRYGDPPASVTALMDVVLIRKWATQLGFVQVRETKEAIELLYEPFEHFSVETLKQLSTEYRGPLSFDFQKTPTFRIQMTSEKLEDTKKLLKTLLHIQKTLEEKE